MIFWAAVTNGNIPFAKLGMMSECFSRIYHIGNLLAATKEHVTFNIGISCEFCVTFITLKIYLCNSAGTHNKQACDSQYGHFFGHTYHI